MVEHSRFHRARANDIDTDACAGEFERRSLRKSFHRVLAADIHCRSWAADLAIRRRDVHNAAFALPKHGPNLVLHAQKYTEHIGVEDVLIRFGSYAEVDLGMAGGGYLIQTRLNVNLRGIEREVAQALANDAHLERPYSKATHGNINVVTNIITDAATGPATHVA